MRSSRRHFGVQSTARLCRSIAHGHHSGSFQISGRDAAAGSRKLETGDFARLPDIRTCNIPDPVAPIRRSTEGFLQRFVGAENIDELRLLFGLSEQDARSIDTYEVRLRNAFSLTAPFDDVEKNFASAMKDKSCAGTQPAQPRMVVRTIVADLDVEFRGRQPISAGIADKLRAAGAQNLSYSGDGTSLRFSLPGRLIALNVK
jgi:hypothetical protein